MVEIKLRELNMFIKEIFLSDIGINVPSRSPISFFSKKGVQ